MSRQTFIMTFSSLHTGGILLFPYTVRSSGCINLLEQVGDTHKGIAVFGLIILITLSDGPVAVVAIDRSPPDWIAPIWVTPYHFPELWQHLRQSHLSNWVCATYQGALEPAGLGTASWTSPSDSYPSNTDNGPMRSNRCKLGQRLSGHNPQLRAISLSPGPWCRSGGR